MQTFKDRSTFKNQLIISTGQEKSCDPINRCRKCPFVIKCFSTLGIKNFLNLMRNFYQPTNNQKNPYSWHYIYWQEIWSFCTKIRNRQRHLLSQLHFSIALDILANAIRQDKEIKGIQIKRNKTLCRSHDGLHRPSKRVNKQ